MDSNTVVLDVVATPTDAEVIARLREELAQANRDLQSLRRRVVTLDSREYQRKQVIADLYKQSKGETMPDHTDIDAAFDRIVELMEDDEDDVWSAERDYEITITYSVTVKGTVRAATEDDALEAAREDLPSLKLADDGCLDDVTLYDTDIDSVEAE